jgi:4-hydroxy-tetrahydrodipicolinate synthase
MPKNRFGLSVALATPFTEQRMIDLPRLVAHGRQSLADGCTSLTVFGTAGEGASLGLNERQRALGALVGAGIDPRRLVIGIAASSVEDAIAQGRAGLMLGCPSFLLAPPFYFKEPGDEGLFDWMSAVLRGLGPLASNVILYHIPQVTAVGLSLDLVDHLRKTFPLQVKGVKDSSGDWANAQALIEHHGEALHILVGDERLLARAMAQGASGAISGLANIAPDLMQPLLGGREEPKVNALVEAVLPYAVTAAVKALVGLRRNDPVAWSRMRAPLRSLGESEVRALGAAVDTIRGRHAA